MDHNPNGLRLSGVVGIRATTLFGVAETIHSHPRVAPKAFGQPWALGHNPLGIAKPVAYLIRKQRFRNTIFTV